MKNRQARNKSKLLYYVAFTAKNAKAEDVYRKRDRRAPEM